MQKRIQRSRPDPVAVMRQFLHHRQPEDRLMRGMNQHMDPYQPKKKFPLLFQHSMNIPRRVRPRIG
jgi:hypothetical protein